MLKVLSTGLQTTFQDLGRFGFRKLGVPLSGVMDQELAQFANSLVGNSLDEAVIEFTVIGPTFEILEDVELAVAGIGFSLQRNNQPISLNQKYFLEKGTILKIGSSSKSVRGYMAVKGGYQIAKVLGSASFYPLISPQHSFEKGNIINKNDLPKNTIEHSVFDFDFSNYETPIINVCKGPEFELLSNEIRKQLFKSEFKVNPQSNRMAVFLDSSIHFSAPEIEIITAPVQPGTVQLTPSGKMIVLMRDAQTTGGYARILQLSDDAINKLAQKPTNQKVVFKVI